jgi:hypothetical protein
VAEEIRWDEKAGQKPNPSSKGKAKAQAPSSGDCVNRLAQLSSEKMEARSIIRWQHRLKREHPTGTERESLIEECGWKGGDSGRLGGEKKLVQRKNNRTHLTPTCLLMEGDYTH